MTFFRPFGAPGSSMENTLTECGLAKLGTGLLIRAPESLHTKYLRLLIPNFMKGMFHEASSIGLYGPCAWRSR